MANSSKKRRLFLSAVFILPLLFISLLSCSRAVNPVFTRCRDLSTTAVSPLLSLGQSPCSSCDNNKSPASNKPSLLPTRDIHIGVLFTKNQPTLDSTVVIVAGLLTTGYRVTITVGPNTNTHIVDEQEDLFDTVLHKITCSLQPTTQSFLTVRFISIELGELPCQAQYNDPGDLDLCSIRNALPVVQAFRRELDAFADRLDLLLVYALSIPGLLTAELSLIPSLMLVEKADALVQVLGSGRTDSDSWWKWLAGQAHDRLHSLKLTASFMALNQARHQLGLARIRTGLFTTCGPVVCCSRQSPSTVGIATIYCIFHYHSCRLVFLARKNNRFKTHQERVHNNINMTWLHHKTFQP